MPEHPSSPDMNPDLITSTPYPPDFKELATRYLDELEEAKRQLEIDFKTGVYNERYFEAEKLRAAAAAEQLGREMRVLVVDSGSLKLINAKYGPPVGDEVIKRLGIGFSDVLRREDVVARRGDRADEFVALLFPNEQSPRLTPKVVEERLQERLAKEPIEAPNLETMQMEILPAAFYLSTALYVPERIDRTQPSFTTPDELLIAKKINGAVAEAEERLEEAKTRKRYLDS